MSKNLEQKVDVDKLLCSLIKRSKSIGSIVKSCLHEQGLRYNYITDMIEVRKRGLVIIEVGDMWCCKKDFYDDNHNLLYEKDCFYHTERPNCITDEKDDVHHKWLDLKKVEEYFEKC